MTQVWENTVFPDVGVFVDKYLRQVYQRQVVDTTDTVWCPEWWRHAEAVARLEVLWRAWEHFQSDADRGMSHWLIDHGDKHMANLLSPTGPFRFCSVRHGHRALLAPLPLTPPPPDRFVQVPRTIYGSLDNFMEKYLCQVYQRQVTDTSETAWCPEWWQHPEAVIRLDALWNSWEYYRVEGGIELSFWFLEYADELMRGLLDPRGPFRFCGVRNGHKDLLEPLPIVAVPPGFFSHPDYTRETRRPHRRA